MPPAPRSPRPRIRSLSVATIRRTPGRSHVAEQVWNAVDVVGRDPQTLGPAHDVAELPAGLADRRCVDDRRQLLEVVEQEPVEQRLVAVLQGGEPDVPLQVVRLATQVFQLEGDLLVDGGHAVRQQPTQTERVAFLFGEGRVAVVRGAGEHRGAARAPAASRPGPGSGPQLLLELRRS